MNYQVFNAASAILRMMNEVLKLSIGNNFAATCKRQAYLDALHVMKRHGLIEGFDATGVIMPTEKPVDVDWTYTPKEGIVGTGFNSRVEAIGYVFELAARGDQKARQAITDSYCSARFEDAHFYDFIDYPFLKAAPGGAIKITECFGSEEIVLDPQSHFGRVIIDKSNKRISEEEMRKCCDEIFLVKADRDQLARIVHEKHK